MLRSACCGGFERHVIAQFCFLFGSRTELRRTVPVHGPAIIAVLATCLRRAAETHVLESLRLPGFLLVVCNGQQI